MSNLQPELHADKVMELDCDSYAANQEDGLRIERTLIAPPPSPKEFAAAAIAPTFAKSQKTRHALVVERLLHRCHSDISPYKVNKRRQRQQHAQPSRIPIRSSRLRAQALLSKAANDLADAISMVRLSPTPQQQQQSDSST